VENLCIDVLKMRYSDKMTQSTNRRTTRPAANPRQLDNHDIAELLALQAETKKPPISKAMRRAARLAHLWPEEASEVFAAGRSLEDLQAVGPYLAKLIREWLQKPPAVAAPPEIRKDFLTLSEARKILRKDASWLAAIKGDLQMHTEWSDGSGTIQEMAEAGEARGYEYISITDHSQGLKIAGGINAQELREQALEIDEVNESLRRAGKKVRVLKSIELNLNPSGEADMDPDSLEGLDVVLGCFHSSLRKTEDQSRRYVAALKNPLIQILGHPRGRIYNYRLGLKADWPFVFGVAAELDKAVEIDGYPDRQDLNRELLLEAKKAGCRISLGTDSHVSGQLHFMELSAAAALESGIVRERIVNCMSRQELIAWARKLQRQRLPKIPANFSEQRSARRHAET
jgi:putative hydrolase